MNRSLVLEKRSFSFPNYYLYPRYDYPFLQNGFPVISG